MPTAVRAAKALITAAMDARRMGHRNALPYDLLEEAAEAYLIDARLDRLGADWLEQTLAYVSEPCKGAARHWRSASESRARSMTPTRASRPTARG